MLGFALAFDSFITLTNLKSMLKERKEHSETKRRTFSFNLVANKPDTNYFSLIEP